MSVPVTLLLEIRSALWWFIEQDHGDGNEISAADVAAEAMRIQHDLIDPALSDSNWCNGEHAWRVAATDWQERALYYRAEAERLRRCLVEHHAQGALDGVLVGDRCPVCERCLADPNWCNR